MLIVCDTNLNIALYIVFAPQNNGNICSTVIVACFDVIYGEN